ncbi:MAG: hypothetical protein JXB85_03790 [Anaerolineales bacterium]|nr:hypothetical protein [Anaerolineales bacterium]
MKNALKITFVSLLILSLVTTTTVIYSVTAGERILHAMVGMSRALILLWIVLGGALMVLLRKPIRLAIGRIRLAWQVKFVLFCILLAMLEEAITTLITNQADLFGAAVGEVYITASTNYLDVILFHSVIVFVPMFIAWVGLLHRWDFSPFWVFLFFGFSGLLAEAWTFGWGHLTEFAVWIFVYGLMVYLPAFSVPAERGARPARWFLAPLAVLLPFVFAVPWALVLGLLFPDHPAIHFPPIQP